MLDNYDGYGLGGYARTDGLASFVENLLFAFVAIISRVSKWKE